MSHTATGMPLIVDNTVRDADVWCGRSTTAPTSSFIH